MKKKTKIVLAVIPVFIVLLVSFFFVRPYVVKMKRRADLRLEARAAFAAEDWKKAEKLLNQYIEQDHNSEEDYVRLAQVYRHFGNTEEEMRCWYRASMLNPLNRKYWDTYTDCAMNARYFPHLYSALSRKLQLNERLTQKDEILFLICAAMTDRTKDVEGFYDLMLVEDPLVFQRDELGRFADFLMTYKKHTPDERSDFFERGTQSDDPVVRLESILFHILFVRNSGEDADYIAEQEESLLKEAVALNRFAATPFLANYYFSHLKFQSVIETAESYLEDIPHIQLAVLYAESCVYGAQPEKLKPLAEHFRDHESKYRRLASYFDVLYDFSQGAEHNSDLVRHMQKMSVTVQTDLSNLIDLQIALNQDSMEKVGSSLETIMRNPPFYNIQDRARSAVRHYLGSKVEKDPSLSEDPRIARLAQLVWNPKQKDLFLTSIIVFDQFRRKVLSRQFIQEATDAFPFDPYLLQVAAKFELLNGNPKKCLEYAERFYALKDQQSSTEFDFLRMTAMELMGRIDDTAKEYLAMLDKTGMDRDILYNFFSFCIEHERKTDLSEMAARLNASDEPDLKALAPFFQAEALFLQRKKDDALSLFETIKTDHPDFALHAANRLSNYDLLDQALSRYLALLDKHPDKRLVLANIAEVYIAKEMKAEALSYAERSWETNQDDALGRFVYAKMLAANDRYQNAEKVLKVPYREVKLTDVVKNLWTDIMLHCVQEDLDNRFFMRALERSNHYLLLYPNDYTFQQFRTRSEREARTIIRNISISAPPTIETQTKDAWDVDADSDAPGD